MRTFAFALMVTLLAASARAEQPADGNVSAAAFFELCQANASGPRAACSSVIGGYIDVYVLLASKDPKMRVTCPPRRMPSDQARFMFTNWAEKRKGLDGMSIGEAVTLALHETFPCMGEGPMTDKDKALDERIRKLRREQ